MKHPITRFMSLSLMAGLILAGCADADADLERARYLLGKGGVSNGAEAVAITEPYLTSNKASIKLEAYRLYVGGRLAQAGFDPIRVLAILVHKESSDIIALMKDAFATITDDAKAFLIDAEAKLGTVIASADYRDDASLRIQQGLQLQYGFRAYMNSLRIFIKTSGLTSITTTFTQADCEATFSVTDANEGTADLKKANDRFSDGAGLDADNPIRESIADIQGVIDTDKDGTINGADALAQIQQICDYLNNQNNVNL